MSKLIPTKEAFQVVDFGLSSIRQTTHGIRKALGKDIRRARKAKVDTSAVRIIRERSDGTSSTCKEFW